MAEEESPNEKRLKLVQFTSNKKITKRAVDACEASSEGSNMRGSPVKIKVSRRDPVPDKTVTPVGYVKVMSESSIQVDICSLQDLEEEHHDGNAQTLLPIGAPNRARLDSKPILTSEPQELNNP